ncbi:MAG: plasmid mobilization relaxosome protein MobC [Atopobiaceae bacterium]|nr:plasmid mobilization relaxosome protein MobC [Atopobiaceae bacterium]
MAELRRLEARLTEEQMERLDTLARDSGLSKTDVLRVLITHASVAKGDSLPDGALIVIDRKTAANIGFQLRKMGINLNQIARSLNSIALAAMRCTDDPTLALDLTEEIEGVKLVLLGYEGVRRSARDAMEALTGRRGVFLDRQDAHAGLAGGESGPFSDLD